MKDLKITYENENGEKKIREYDTIMDFVDEMESDRVDIPMMDYGHVVAKFFENPLREENFSTIEQLYLHCKSIIR